MWTFTFTTLKDPVSCPVFSGSFNKCVIEKSCSLIFQKKPSKSCWSKGTAVCRSFKYVAHSSTFEMTQTGNYIEVLGFYKTVSLCCLLLSADPGAALRQPPSLMDSLTVHVILYLPRSSWRCHTKVSVLFFVQLVSEHVFSWLSRSKEIYIFFYSEN